MSTQVTSLETLLHPLQQAFNRAEGSPRLIALVSPT